ncbi:IS5 family transposase [Bacteroides acidifaciens]|uniref:IS5 family transposase n=1 Tax=Bacteroides acidifaciens TaxID=85831 RepID=UPI00259B1392|nr:IS5 family transposase [Bacteroides acidifaciens]
MRKEYPSDISREQFEIIRKDIEEVKKKTHPQKYDLYDIFCAALYLLKEGCTWRAIPHDYPNWQNVRYHYDIWAKPDEDGVSLLDRALRKLVEMERKENERSSHTTMIIVDSKSIQNADTAQSKGYDAGKKPSGIKLHIGVDILGLPHAIMITTADVTDRNGAIDMVDYYCDITDNLSLIKKVLVDGGYTGQNFADEIKRISKAEVEVVKRNELHTFSVIPKRWIVERSFGWIDKCRRLWKNCERLLQNSFQMFSLAFIRIILKRY